MIGFKNRSDAGKRLAAKLQVYTNRPNAIVLGLPRGGIPVAFEVATKLGLPLDVFVVRKLGVPGHEEFAMGAIASGGIRVLNEDTIRSLNIPREMIESVAEKQGEELKRREQLYRGNHPHLDVKNLTVILVDDGLATGATMRAAVQALRKQKPLSIIVAVPAAAPEACEELGEEADDIICAITPDPFFSVGSWYEDFSQTTDDEVRQLLKIAHEAEKNMGGEIMTKQAEGGTNEQAVKVTFGSVTLDGILVVPPTAEAIAVFAHGSGSSRFSYRNLFVAEALQKKGLATLLFDLLTAKEEGHDRKSGDLRFDISLLTTRLAGATTWLASQKNTKDLAVGYFGASTGAAAALSAAAMKPDVVKAVVSRGGRPDLAGPALKDVKAPTLLIVGGLDTQVLSFNKNALAQMTAQRKLEIVPGATHLFGEPGTLEAVARLASQWFYTYLVPGNPPEIGVKSD